MSQHMQYAINKETTLCFRKSSLSGFHCNKSQMLINFNIWKECS